MDIKIVEDSLPFDFEEESVDEVEFIPCSKCDGHPACEDFGCAYELGLSKMVKNDTL